ncbi:hypothetical protein J7E63_14410 [Bacillus sp. ISL-75]|uniref:hypothetical protein n=1 Tax=Bacillus sp. ISL-75 TaxID=2819137 RepID=UPI001BE6E638|nr:hypothetical protein [Bacillus sp. ISL-75]MBT2728131.1 hypothetical protein [Bacillus sp. ISL-75]
MDKVTDWAFLLFNETTDDEVKETAIKLLVGDLSLKELIKMDNMKVHFIAVKKKRRKGCIKSKELNQFIEDHLLLGD